MTDRESPFSEEYREPTSPKKAEDDESQRIDKEYLDSEKPWLNVIKAEIFSEEKGKKSDSGNSD